jgi:hypothetical protein
VGGPQSPDVGNCGATPEVGNCGADAA